MASKSNDEWVQIAPDIAFQSKVDRTASTHERMNRVSNMVIERMLSSSSRYPSTSTSPYSVGVDDINQGWGNEQLAWHLLGFYIDCNSQADDHEDEHQNRYLGSATTNTVCKRKVMYAVYVDKNYEAGGLGQYTYYDQDSGNYTCHNDGNCRAKMDCHSSDSETWQLVGIFKIDKLSERDGWMEQLFKHAGVCYWGWDIYSIASTLREILPHQCTKTNYKTLGSSLYMDLKPIQNAGLTLGLYTDNKCSQPYEKGNSTSNYDVFGLIGTSESDFNTFNTLLNGYKTCQPCVAYNLTDYDFTCSDDAGYNNCPQCTKFAVKAQSSWATPQEIKLAYMQQSMLPLSNRDFSIETSSLFRDNLFDDPLRASMYFFIVCLVIYFLPRKSRSNSMLKVPLSPETVATVNSNDSWDSPPRSSDNIENEGIMFATMPPPKIKRESKFEIFQKSPSCSLLEKSSESQFL